LAYRHSEKLNRYFEDEKIGILGVFLLLLIVFKIIFFKESIISIAKFLATYFWFFFIPGFVFMLYWKPQLDFFTRLIAGFGFGVVITTFFDYYLGLIGMTYMVRIFLIPLGIITGSLVVLRISKGSRWLS